MRLGKTFSAFGVTSYANVSAPRGADAADAADAPSPPTRIATPTRTKPPSWFAKGGATHSMRVPSSCIDTGATTCGPNWHASASVKPAPCTTTRRPPVTNPRSGASARTATAPSCRPSTSSGLCARVADASVSNAHSRNASECVERRDHARRGRRDPRVNDSDRSNRHAPSGGREPSSYRDGPARPSPPSSPPRHPPSRARPRVRRIASATPRRDPRPACVGAIPERARGV